MHDNPNELALLLCGLWCGFALGIVYDLLRLLRRGKLLSAIADALFGGCFFALTAATLLYADSGRLRPFMLPSELLAFCVFEFGPSAFLRRTVFKKRAKRPEQAAEPDNVAAD